MPDKKIRLLLITVRTDIGGGPKSVLMLSKYLSSDFDIYIACPTDPPYYNLYKQNDRIKGYYNIPHRKFLIHKYFGLAFFVLKNKIQIINSNGTGAGFYARLVKILCPQVKIIHTFRGVNTKNIGSLKNRLYFLYEKLFSHLTNKFINVSHGEQNLCITKGILNKEKSVVIHNGIETVEKNTSFVLKELKGKFIIATLSRFDYPKNMFQSYKIAEELKNYSDIAFLWIGDGDDKEHLEKLAIQNQVNIFFTGFKDNVADYLSISDLYLSTSRWEGLPLALLEASSLGIPIVATNIIGNNEVVKDGINGFLFESDDISGAIDSILKLYGDKDLNIKFGKESRKNFEENFSVCIMAANTSKVFKELITQ